QTRDSARSSTSGSSDSPRAPSGRGAAASCPAIWRRSDSSWPTARCRADAMLLPGVSLAAIAALLAAIGFEPGSALRHLYLVPTLWAAFAVGAPGGAVIGLLSGLLQAPVALPAVEQLGLTTQTIDGLVSLATPLAFGWVLGGLVDRSRERAARLQAVLEV